MGKWPLPLDKPLYREQRDGWEAALRAVIACYDMAAHHRLRLVRAGQRLDELEKDNRELARKLREEQEYRGNV